MLESNWRIVLTLGLLIFGLAFAWLAREHKEAEARYEAAKAEYEYAKEHTPIGAPVGGSEPAITDPKTYQEEWRAEQDLFAQRSMALSTEDMVFATWIGIGVTIIGIFFVAKTLEATHDMIREAGRATSAAERTIESTERVGNAQIRAYLVVTECFMSASADRTRPVFRIKIKNSGQTPAKNIQCRYYIFYDREPWDYGNGYKGHPFRDLAAGESDNLTIDFETPIFPEDGRLGDNHTINAHFILLYNTVVDEEDRVDAFYFTFAGSLSSVTAIAGGQVKMGQSVSPKAQWGRGNVKLPDPGPFYDEDENTGH